MDSQSFKIYKVSQCNSLYIEIIIWNSHSPLSDTLEVESLSSWKETGTSQEISQPLILGMWFIKLL